MASNNLDRICRVNIEISSPIVDGASFEHILILGPAPKGGAEVAHDVGVYAGLDEVIAAGWVAVGEDADPVGVAARVAFSQDVPPAHIYIAVQRNKTTKGAEAPEPITDTLTRALGVNGWYVACPAGVDEKELEGLAGLIEANTKLMGYTTLSSTPPVRDAYYRTFGMYGRESVNQDDAELPAENHYSHVAEAVRYLKYQPGSETWAMKPLSAISVSRLSSADIQVLEDANLNYYIPVGSENLTMGGKVMAGEWIDVVRFRDWLENDMQLRVVNIFVESPKIPYTDRGIGLVHNQMIASLEAGTEAGGIAEDEFDERGARIPGFTTSVPLSARITSAQKKSRKLTGCKFKARLAGAIHMTEIDGNLAYSL